MKREIKFRGWDNSKKEMCYFKNIGYEPYFKTLYFTSMPYNDTGVCKKGYNIDDTIMQFTGLHDKNGKEIYEGDLVKVTWTDIYRKNDVTVEVKWNNGYHFPNSGAHTNDFEMEVIGNIFKRVEKV